MEITIVTAFFNIGRENWKGFERDNGKYVDFFKFWAGIKNKLIIYTDCETAQQVLQIRDAFGLKERTQVIVIDDIKTLAPEVYEKMAKVLSHRAVVEFRTEPDHPECYNAIYDYLMFLKPYFIVDAIQKGLVDGMVAWMDFGYNHGGKYYANPLDFNFLWKYDFSNKIHIFAIKSLDDTPVFEIIRTLETYIAGSIIVAPVELWKTLQHLFGKAVFALTDCGLIDDDQTLLIMAYREYPDLFEIHYVEHHFSQLKEHCDNHFTIAPQNKKQYKKTRKMARKFYKNGHYQDALQCYWKSAIEEISYKLSK